MKLKRVLVFVLALALVACAAGIIACKPAIKDADMSGITFSDKTELYDGTAKTLTVTGTLPEGVSVAYEYYKGDVKVTEAKEVGVYTVKAKFTVDTQKYNAIDDMTAKLTISYNMQGVVLQDKTVTYNGNAHTIEITGTLPEGVSVSYEYYLGTEKVNEAKNAGTYVVKAKFSGSTPIEDLSATLTIKKAVPSVTFGSKQYRDLDGIKTLEEPLIYSEGDGGYYYEYDGKNYILGVVDSDVEILDEDISYYTEINQDGTPKEDSVTLDNILSSVGDTLYVVVDLQESANYAAKQYVAKVTLHSKTIAISTYDELCKLNSDTKDYPREVRLNFRYVLQNDIDCENRVWKTVDTIFGSTGMPFCSEFDGNGHTISNFRLTNESVDADKLADQNGLHIGFFGYVTDAYIHDVTFDRVTANIDKTGYDRQPVSGGNCVNPIVFGVVVARMECDGSNGFESDLKNIKVSNADIKIAGYKAYVGVIVGWDHAKSEGILRDNLSVENVTINAIATTNDKDKVSVGGIVGETQGSDIIKYTNCNVKNLVITSKDENNESTGSLGNNYFGALIGRVSGTSITFENCDVVNYAGMANVNIYISQDSEGRFTGAGSYGYFGYGSYITDYGTLVNNPDLKFHRYFPSVLKLVNCTHSVEEGKENEYYLEVNGTRVDWIDNDNVEAVGPNGELMFKDRSHAE